MMENFAIMKPFNLTFFAVTAFFVLLLVGATFLMKHKSDKAKRIVIASAAILTLIGFVFYKYFLSIDAEYNVLTASKGGFNWWGELPLQLCNINMLLIPIAVLFNIEMLMSFCFFVGSIGATMAIVMPGMGFSDCSIFLPRMLGYFGTHYMIVIMAIAIVSFGLYRPKYRDFPRTCLTIFGISFCVFLINELFIQTGVFTDANYFYTMNPEGNPLLELFHRLIPVPFLYLLPSLLILLPYMAVVTLGFWLADRKKAALPTAATAEAIPAPAEETATAEEEIPAPAEETAPAEEETALAEEMSEN